MESAPLYEYQPSFILGFHGCDEEVGMKILCQQEKHLTPSEEKHDWLGHGIYFWEGNVARAWEWANQSRKVKKPFVLGAIIDLKHCLDLFDLASMMQVKKAHAALEEVVQLFSEPMPQNTGKTEDKLFRALDCAVLNTLHGIRKVEKKDSYDSVRGPFIEGDQIYPGAGFRTHTHIQLCVRNTDCIKGYFKPIGTEGFTSVK